MRIRASEVQLDLGSSGGLILHGPAPSLKEPEKMVPVWVSDYKNTKDHLLAECVRLCITY